MMHLNVDGAIRRIVGTIPGPNAVAAAQATQTQPMLNFQGAPVAVSLGDRPLSEHSRLRYAQPLTTDVFQRRQS